MPTQCICRHCGAVFTVRPSEVKRGRGRSCSPLCRDTARRLPLAQRFWAFFQKSDGCWEWTGKLLPNGYGAIRGEAIDGSPTITGHRVSWEIHYGPIPDGMFVCHRCDNRRCVRPDHLFLGTHQDNMTDMVSKGRGEGARGERSGSVRLSEANVRQIRQDHADGVTQTALARRFGVGIMTINHIVHRRTWTHIE